MGRPKRRDEEFDRELADLPPAARWREWLLRAEAAIFAAPSPVRRESLARVVGSSRNLDDLLADLAGELRGRPYDLVFVAGRYQLRTKPRFAAAIRAADAGPLRDAGLPELTPTEILAVTAIAYLQPATRAQVSQLAGKDISRDIIAALKRRHPLVGRTVPELRQSPPNRCLRGPSPDALAKRINQSQRRSYKSTALASA